MGKGIALTFCDIQFLSFGHIFANFHAYIVVRSKVMNILSHLPGSFQYFQFLWKGLNIKLQQFVTIVCWNIYHQTCRYLFCLFTFFLLSVLTNRCSENMQQVFKGTFTPKTHFNKVTTQFAVNRITGSVKIVT